MLLTWQCPLAPAALVTFLATAPPVPPTPPSTLLSDTRMALAALLQCGDGRAFAAVFYSTVAANAGADIEQQQQWNDVLRGALFRAPAARQCHDADVLQFVTSVSHTPAAVVAAAFVHPSLSPHLIARSQLDVQPRLLHALREALTLACGSVEPGAVGLATRLAAVLTACCARCVDGSVPRLPLDTALGLPVLPLTHGRSTPLAVVLACYAGRCGLATQLLSHPALAVDRDVAVAAMSLCALVLHRCGGLGSLTHSASEADAYALLPNHNRRQGCSATRRVDVNQRFRRLQRTCRRAFPHLFPEEDGELDHGSYGQLDDVDDDADVATVTDTDAAVDADTVALVHALLAALDDGSVVGCLRLLFWVHPALLALALSRAKTSGIALPPALVLRLVGATMRRAKRQSPATQRSLAVSCSLLLQATPTLVDPGHDVRPEAAFTSALPLVRACTDFTALAVVVELLLGGEVAPPVVPSHLRVCGLALVPLSELQLARVGSGGDAGPSCAAAVAVFQQLVCASRWATSGAGAVADLLCRVAEFMTGEETLQCRPIVDMYRLSSKRTSAATTSSARSGAGVTDGSDGGSEVGGEEEDYDEEEEEEEEEFEEGEVEEGYAPPSRRLPRNVVPAPRSARRTTRVRDSRPGAGVFAGVPPSPDLAPSPWDVAYLRPIADRWRYSRDYLQSTVDVPVYPAVLL